MAKITWIETGEELLSTSLAYDTGEELTPIKVRLLTKLGITLQPGEIPLDAWIRHLHQINGLEYQKPAHPEITDAILSTTSACRFMWFLA